MLFKDLSTGCTYSHDNIQDLYFYKDGSVVVKFDYFRFEETNTNNGKIETVYNRALVSANLFAVKRSNKLNLNRKDNFIIKSSSDAYFPKQYDLYIYCGDTGDAFIDLAGEYLYSEHDGEKDYMNAYSVYFRYGYTVKTTFREYIDMDDPGKYELLPGERFSSSIGTKENKCIDTFDFSKSLFKKCDRKGIVKSWYENADKIEMFTVKSAFITRIYRDADRLEREAIAEDFSKILNVSISHYQIEKLLKSYSVTKKG